MRNTVVFIIGVCLLSVSGIAWTAAQQVQPASASTTYTPTSIDEMLQAVRADLQGERSDIIAKNLTLTSAQAAKFWPLFEAYQKEQNVIMDDQLQGIQRYIENFDSLDDAGARALDTKFAVRVMQIDRRLSLAHQLQFATKIPLIH